VCINEWLMREGWLVPRSMPDGPRPLAPADVDWSRTRAWGEGGYYARIHLNVEGREPEGIVPPRERPAVREEIAAALEAMVGPGGAPLGNVVYRPESVFRQTRGLAPDLMAFFGDLRHRSIGSVGHGSIFTEANDTGPDACNHDWYGVFVLSGAGAPAAGRLAGLSLYDVTPTVLGLLGVAVPPALLGRDRSAP